MQTEWTKLGEEWLKGAEIKGWSLAETKEDFLPKQIEFINDKNLFLLFSGGFGCGKTSIMLKKAILLSLFFPDNFGLIGRKTYPELETSTLIDFWNIVPQEEIKSWEGKNRIVTFKNGSKIIFFHLDVLQASSQQEQKKALAEIKSMNLGWFAIDQAEEVEEPVFQALRGRLRRQVPFRQGMMSANPALSWLFKFFKQDRKDGYCLIESSTLENAKNLPKEYVDDLLSYPDLLKRQFVYGEWTDTLFSDRAVFPIEYIREQSVRESPPIRFYEGLRIWKEPEYGHSYRIGADPSEGIDDPCALAVFDETSGEVVALWRARIPADTFATKIEQVARIYGENHKVILEINGIGMATLSRLKDMEYIHLYEREEVNDQTKTKETKYGWKTTIASKPLLVANFLELLRKNKIKIYAEEIIAEMKSFVYTDASRSKGMGAASGFHDDLIIATMLSVIDCHIGEGVTNLALQGATAFKSGDY